MLRARKDIRGALAGREGIAAIALGSLAFTTALSAMLHIGVATLERTLQQELGGRDGTGNVVQIEAGDHATNDDARRALTKLESAAGMLPRGPARTIVERRSARVRGMSRERTVEVLGVSANLPQLQVTTIREGRWFTEREQHGDRANAVLGRSLVDSLFAGRTPREIRLAGRVFAVIGVVESGAVAPIALDRSVMVTRTMLRRLALPGSLPPSMLAEDARHRQHTGVYDLWRLLERTRPQFAGRLSFVTSQQRLGDIGKLADALRAGASLLSVVLAVASLVTVAALMITIARGHARAVGVMRALGATRVQIAALGLSVGALVSVVGVGSGVVLATVGAVLLPVWFGFPAITTVAVISALVEAAALPSMIAATAGVVSFAWLGMRTPASLLA